MPILRRNMAKQRRLLFEKEIPDPDQELFIERGEDLKEFHLFPALPPEVRRMTVSIPSSCKYLY